MAIRNRMPPWHENFTLPNGHTLLLRPVRPEDGPPLQGAFDLLEPAEIRKRLVRPASDITPDQLQRLTHPNPKNEIVLVAAETLPPGEAVIGAIARATVLPGSREAEYTILVSRFVAGQGLGRQLMRKLVKWARRKYLDRVWGDALRSNVPMLELAESLGFKPQPHPDSPELVRMVLELEA
ncbi:MAG: GNAT family N-acetyltransferase [Pseudomonas sp.]